MYNVKSIIYIMLAFLIDCTVFEDFRERYYDFFSTKNKKTSGG